MQSRGPGDGIPSKALLAKQLVEQFRVGDAAELMRKHVAQHPKDLAAYGVLCHCLLLAGQAEQSAFFAAQGRRLFPDHPELWVAHARALQFSGDFAGAQKLLDEARAKFPTHSAVAGQQIELWLRLGAYAEIDELCTRAEQEGWADPILLAGHGQALHRLGDVTKAKAWARHFQWLRPTDLASAETAATTMLYDWESTPEQVASAHKRVGMIYADMHGDRVKVHPKGDNPERPLRVGILSPDLRQHSVASFARGFCEGVLRGGHTLIIYYTGFKGDAVTERFRALASHFLVCGGLSPETMLARIASDKVDVLVELSGHTVHNSLALMSLKPAPVSISAIGYPATTGLRTIDWRLVDEVTDPPGCEALLSEKPLRIPAPFLCFEPPADAPDIDPIPACERAGHVTFAAFNALHKINPQTIAMWARVLERVPGSKILLKAAKSQDAKTQQYAVRRFTEAGLPPERVVWMSHVDGRRAHLETYNRCDVSLDPFPYHGTTSSCESFDMGVPVVSLAGGSHVSRVGRTLLRSVGLEELAVDSPEKFVDVAAGLATDRPRLGELRRTLRGRLRGGRLCDAESYKTRIAEAIRGAWRAHCAVEAGWGI